LWPRAIAPLGANAPPFKAILAAVGVFPKINTSRLHIMGRGVWLLILPFAPRVRNRVPARRENHAQVDRSVAPWNRHHSRGLPALWDSAPRLFDVWHPTELPMLPTARSMLRSLRRRWRCGDVRRRRNDDVAGPRDATSALLPIMAARFEQRRGSAMRNSRLHFETRAARPPLRLTVDGSSADAA